MTKLTKMAEAVERALHAEIATNGETETAATLRAAAEHLRASEWRTMESAPKDGTRILTFKSDSLGEGIWCAKFMGRDWNASGWSGCSPSHWRPLPAPPEGE